MTNQILKAKQKLKNQGETVEVLYGGKFITEKNNELLINYIENSVWNRNTKIYDIDHNTNTLTTTLIELPNAYNNRIPITAHTPTIRKDIAYLKGEKFSYIYSSIGVHSLLIPKSTDEKAVKITCNMKTGKLSTNKKHALERVVNRKKSKKASEEILKFVIWAKAVSKLVGQIPIAPENEALENTTFYGVPYSTLLEYVDPSLFMLHNTTNNSEIINKALNKTPDIIPIHYGKDTIRVLTGVVEYLPINRKK